MTGGVRWRTPSHVLGSAQGDRCGINQHRQAILKTIRRTDGGTMNCRACHHALGEHAIADGTTRDPQDGDLSVCLYCGALSIFRGGSVMTPTYQEMDELTREQSVIEAMYAALFIRRKMAEAEAGGNGDT
jgi:hypothetical protein